MDADGWDARYAAVDRVWHEPNGWLVDLARDLEPGRALDLACGEGRNAVWLAAQGWDVTAVDFSQVGVAKGRAAAPEVDWVCADLREWTPPAAAYDLVALLYLHVAADDLRAILDGAAAAVAPGGLLLVAGHDRRNRVGGPQDGSILLDPGEVAGHLAPLEIVRAETVERPTPDGVALDTVVVARAQAAEPARD